MNHSRLRPLLALLLGITGCAGVEIYSDAKKADRLFDEIAGCARRNPESFHSNCRRDFEEVEFNVRVDSVKTLGVTYFTLFGEMGDPNQMVNCSLRGGRQRALIDALHKGDVTRLRATPSRVSFGEVSFIHFEDCEIAQ